jgi:DegV family protein with EDD domain
MAEAGAPIAAIIARLEVVRQRMRIFLSLDNLRFARMSGRVGMVKALLTSLLDVKPMLAVNTGKLELAGRARSRAQALIALVDSLQHALAPQVSARLRLAVIHAQAPQVARRLVELCTERFGVRPEVVYTLSIGIAVHFGPGTVGVVGYGP